MTNLLQLARTMRIVDKPWGYEVIWAETDRYVGKRLVIRPKERLSRQYHVKKDETFHVLSGDMRLELGHPVDEDFRIIDMRVGSTFHCPPRVVHRMVAGHEGVEVLEVSTPELDDVVRLDDDYGR